MEIACHWGMVANEQVVVDSSNSFDEVKAFKYLISHQIRFLFMKK